MLHRRTVLRNAMRDVLIGAMPQHSSWIYKHRSAAIDRTPAMRIYTPEERLSEERQEFGAERSQSAQVVVEVLVQANKDADDLVDSICLSVESAVMNELARADAANELPFDRGCAGMVLVSTSIDYEDDNNTKVQATMTFEASTQQEFIQE